MLGICIHLLQLLQSALIWEQSLAFPISNHRNNRFTHAFAAQTQTQVFPLQARQGAVDFSEQSRTSSVKGKKKKTFLRFKSICEIQIQPMRIPWKWVHQTLHAPYIHIPLSEEHALTSATNIYSYSFPSACLYWSQTDSALLKLTLEPMWINQIDKSTSCLNWLQWVRVSFPSSRLLIQTFHYFWDKHRAALVKHGPRLHLLTLNASADTYWWEKRTSISCFVNFCFHLNSH